jgi:hypothetical protein
MKYPPHETQYAIHPAAHIPRRQTNAIKQNISKERRAVYHEKERILSSHLLYVMNRILSTKFIKKFYDFLSPFS